MIKLSEKAKEKLSESNIIKGKLCIAFDKQMRTIDSWIKNDNPMLTARQAIFIIQEGTGLSDKEMFESENTNKTK